MENMILKLDQLKENNEMNINKDRLEEINKKKEEILLKIVELTEMKNIINMKHHIIKNKYILKNIKGGEIEYKKRDEEFNKFCKNKYVIENSINNKMMEKEQIFTMINEIEEKSKEEKIFHKYVQMIKDITFQIITKMLPIMTNYMNN